MLVESVTELAVVRLIKNKNTTKATLGGSSGLQYCCQAGIRRYICKAKLVCSASCHADMREYATLGECSLTYSCRAGRVR